MKTYKYEGIFILTILNFLVLNYALKLEKAKVAKSATGKKDDPLGNMSDADLDKMMKEYGISNSDLGILGSNGSTSKGAGKSQIDDPLKGILETDKKAEEKKLTMKDVWFKNKEALHKFDLSQRDAFNLILLMKKFNFFHRLPLTAMNIIAEVEKKESFNKILKLQKDKTQEMNYLISNTLNSQVFIDHENKIGRKGMVSIIEKDSAEVKHVWAVLNNKVFSFFRSSNYLSIFKIYRISMLKIRDFTYIPCFFLYYDNGQENNFENSQTLICTLNYREKDIWINTLHYHQETYKDFDNTEEDISKDITADKKTSILKKY
jgi:hypothetical protein